MVDALFDWLLDGAPGVTAPAQIAQRLGDDLRGAGVPLDRLAVFITTLHPNVLGRAFYWEPDHEVRVFELTAAVRSSDEYVKSPVGWVYEHGEELRWRAGDSDRGWDMLGKLAAGGVVDYLALPLRFTNGEVHVITFATKTGFSDDHVGVFRRVCRPLARVAEIFALRRVAKNVLETYVGRIAGERVLAGRIFRGDVETIRAAIWFSDLRGFTELSARISAKQLVGVLNDVFECQVAAIERHDGEVLKFIGDGLLAIFPIADATQTTTRCAAALAAAAEAFAALATCRPESGDVRIGLALHVGDVEYGNIGGSSRLDFTVIGSAVNQAARLEGIASKLGRPLVVSEEFAAASGRSFESVGEFELKGITGAKRVLVPRGA